MRTIDPQTITYVITAIVVALVLALRFRSLRRPKRLRLETLWIVPLLYLVLITVSIWEYPPEDARTWAWLAIALGIGLAIGWRRGKLMRITIDPVTHKLNQQASPAALLVIVVLILARQGLRYEADRLGLDMLQLTGILMAFALGLFTATRAEMFLRARRMLVAVRR